MRLISSNKLEEYFKMENRKPKIIIYTAITGGYDTSQDVTPFQRENVEFRCVCDPPEFDKLRGWQPLSSNHFDNAHFPDYCRYAKINRMFKLQPKLVAQDSDINVYIDGNKYIIDIDMIIKYCNDLWNSDLDAFFCKHTERDKVAQEVKEVIKLKRDKPEIVLKQFQEYKQVGFPDDIPLIVASVQFRKTNADALNKMLDCWWNEVKNKSYRDQISMPYAIWRTGFDRYKLLNVWTERLKMIGNAPHEKVLTV